MKKNNWRAVLTGLFLFGLETFLPSVLAAQGNGGGGSNWSLRFFGGGAFLGGGDLNDCTEGVVAIDQASKWFSASGEFKPLHWGPETGIEVRLNLTPHLALGLGVGYISAARDTMLHIHYSDGGEAVYDNTFGPSIRVVPVTLDLHAGLPLGRGLDLELTAGGGLYFGRAGYNVTWTGYGDAPSGQDTWRGTSQALGAQAGVGLNVRLSSALFLVLEAAGRYVKMSDFQGDLDLNGTVTREAYFWYVQQGLYPLYYFDKAAPPDVFNSVRKGHVDLSGVSLCAGLLLRL